MARRLEGRMVNAIIDNVRDAAVGIAKDGRIVICNRQADELLCGGMGELEGKKIWDVMEINDFTRAFVAMVKDSNPAPMEQIISLFENRVFLVKMLPVYDSDGRFAGAVAILEDLTDIHKMEQTVNEFVAMVSHELKTPLTSIKGFVETLLEGAYSSPEVTRKFLQVINEETNRMTRLVISLLDLSNMMRDSSGEDYIQPVNTSIFISEAVKLFEPVAKERGIKLGLDVPDNLPAVNADPDKLRQVIINLVDNAIKFTGVRGEGRVDVCACIQDKCLCVHIKDNGPGIPQGEQDKIFEKFYRIRNGPAAELGGTGLGLSITRQIIASHGGEIKVKSSPGEGAQFSFMLPLAVKEENSRGQKQNKR